MRRSAFTRGVPLYSTLLAVEDGHGPAVGVIHLPALGETVAAGRGLGCTHDGARAMVSMHDRLEGALLTASGYDYWDEAMLLSAKRAGAVLRTWGDGYGYALVATGRAEAMVDPVAKTWDLAAMPVILGEAGGAFSDLNGGLRADGGSGVATTAGCTPSCSPASNRCRIEPARSPRTMVRVTASMQADD